MNNYLEVDVKEVKRYRADWRHVVTTAFDDAQFVGTADYDAALSKLAAETLRADTAEAELAKANKSADTYLAAWEKCAEFRDASEDKLKAAEQRVSELSADNQQLRKLLNQTPAALNPTAKLAKSIRAALNPKPEAGSPVDCGSCRNITDGCKDKCQRSEDWGKS